MKRVLKSIVAWVIICVICSAACMVAGVLFILFSGCPNLGVTVFFLGTLMSLLALGVLD